MDFGDQIELEVFVFETMATFTITDFEHQLESLKTDLLRVDNAEGHYLTVPSTL